MGSKFVEYVRGPPPLPGERKLLRKLDFFILTFCCLMYWANYVSWILLGIL
jgi:ACS family pantothenate transporter-like MFS transporter